MTDNEPLWRVQAERDALAAAIKDIDDHATPLGEDEDGFVATGYLVSVGSMHRAINALHKVPDSLATRPEPHVYDVMGVLWRPESGHGPWSFRTQRAGRAYPEGHEFVTVYRRGLAGSATPTEDDNGN